MLGVIKVLGVNAASQQTLFIVSGLPIHPMLEGGDPNAMLGVIKFLGVNAAWQQTLFIVSSSQSIQCQREVTQMLYWGFKSPGAMLLRSKLFPYQDHQKLQVNTLLFKAFSFYRETNCCEWIIGESTLVIIGKYNTDVSSLFIGKQTVELQANHPPQINTVSCIISLTAIYGNFDLDGY